MKVIFRTFYFLICFAFDVFSMQLQVDVFDVGQGNFVVLRTETNALVVDCGCTQTAGNPIKHYIDKYAQTALGDYVRGIFRDKETRVIITHEHKDHFNLLEYFDLTSKPTLHYSNAINAANNFRNALGDNIIVDVLFLEARCVRGLQTYAFGETDHDKNLVIKVTTTSAEGEQRSVLLTGDANGTLLSSLLCIPKNREILKDIDCLIVPHHGSNDRGEFAWLKVKDFISGNRLLPQLLSIVCSDPDIKKSQTIDFLPWPDIVLFSYKRDSHNQAFSFVQEHEIATRSSSKTSGKWSLLTCTTNAPVFATCGASQGFYRVNIMQNGDMALYDSFLSEPLYFSVSSHVEKGIFTELFSSFEGWLQGQSMVLTNIRSSLEERVLSVFNVKYVLKQMLPLMPVFVDKWQEFLQALFSIEQT